MSKIEWTEATWNPVTGCTKKSAGCKNCYADRMAKRLQAMGMDRYRNGFKLTLQPDKVQEPLSWRKPRLVFVNSMSDLFHKEVPTEYIQEVFAVMEKAHWHRFQVLTKRSVRLMQLAPKLPWPDNIWMGVSVEDGQVINRASHLKMVPAKVRFISAEPLIGSLVGMEMKGIDWCIVGGESGPKARPMKEEWVTEIQEMCKVAGTPFFFKQWGGVNKKKTGRVLQGQTWDEMPVLAAAKATIP